MRNENLSVVIYIEAEVMVCLAYRLVYRMWTISSIQIR